MPQEEHAVPVTPKAYYHDEVTEKATAGGVPMLSKEEEVSAGPRQKRFLFWSLSKKNWIIALVSSILVVILVILLILFLAILPAVFQHQVDKVGITLNHLDLLKMSGDRNSNEINVELSVHLATDSMASSTLYETDVTLSYNGKAFGIVTLPETKIKKGKDEFDIVVDGPSQIVSQDAFREVSTAVVQSEKLDIDISATVKVHGLGLTYGGLDLKRTVQIKGLNQFSNPPTKIKHIAIPGCNPTNYQLLANISLDNESSVGLNGVGQLNLTVYYQQQYLGQAITTHPTAGVPRGSNPTEFLVTIQREDGPLAALGSLLKGVIAKKAQLYITGESPYAATEAVLLDQALTKLNVSVLYTDGIANIALNTSTACAGLISLLS